MSDLVCVELFVNSDPSPDGGILGHRDVLKTIVERKTDLFGSLGIFLIVLRLLESR
jgi:hypothetical protein